MNVEQYLEYGGILLTQYSSTECCESCTMLCPGDSAVNKTYLASKECKVQQGVQKRKLAITVISYNKTELERDSPLIYLFTPVLGMVPDLRMPLNCG